MSQSTHFEIDQGADLILQLELANSSDNTPKDLTNHTIHAWIKQSYSYDSTQATKFTSDIIDAPNGMVNLTLTNSQTDALDYRRKHLFDIEVHHFDSDLNNIVEVPIKGTITIKPSVTK